MADYVVVNGEPIAIPHELEADPEGRAAFVAEAEAKAAPQTPPKTEEE